ncbi:hypothetical protein MKW94_016107 [Papaver nudicaule]|uniref:Uncharacterized protein n=1 Tax=Papaver nudicaule TaxID=74823 RepID=A0AA41RYR6_PAPNU|nr:hypothetical protein [Papaver nudicaule]
MSVNFTAADDYVVYEPSLVPPWRHMEPEEPGYVSGSSLESHIGKKHNDSYTDDDDGTEEETEEEEENNDSDNDDEDGTEEETEEAHTTCPESYYEADIEDDLDLSNMNLSDQTLSSIREYNRRAKEFVRNIPSLKGWVDSWPSGNSSSMQISGYYFLNIFGYYRKKKKSGGYGVVLRDPYGRPVIASALAQSSGKSNLYHVLDGVNAGLSLAVKHGIYDLKLMCNSQFLDGRLRKIFRNVEPGFCCPANPECDGGCEICLSQYMGIDDKEYFKSLYPILVEILQKRYEIDAKANYFCLADVFRNDNKAAYCLAKQHAKDVFRYKLASPQTVYEPGTFSDELMMILWADCFVGRMKYSEQAIERDPVVQKRSTPLSDILNEIMSDIKAGKTDQ